MEFTLAAIREGWAGLALGPRGLLASNTAARRWRGRARREWAGQAGRLIVGSPCSMSGMISGGHNPLGTPGTSPSQNDLASLIQA